MKKSEYRFFVKYADTDKMGYVYYANYLVWFEAARTYFLRELGYPYKKMEEENIFLPVVEAYCKYLSPSFYEDNILIESWIGEIKNVSLKIFYNVIREDDNKLLAKGYTKHTSINKAGKLIKLPEKFLNVISDYIEEEKSKNF